MDAARASVAAAQAAARRGDGTAAREHLEAAIASADSEVRRFRRVAGAVAAGLTSAAAAGGGGGNGSDDGGGGDGTRRGAPEVALQEALHTRGEAQLALAEMLWQQGEKPLALRSYEGALDAARGAGDSGREGMISLGMGYALLNSADPALLPTALKAMRRSKELAQEQGHNAQVTFVESLIVQAEERQRAAAAADEEEEAAVQPLRTEEEEQAAMLAAFVQSLVRRSPIMLFLKGTALKPTCGFSLAAARQLMALEVDFSDVDVGADAQLRDAVKKFAQWPTFPQLWVGGQLLGGHDILKELGAEEDADGVGGGGGGLLAAIDAQLLSTAAGEDASGVLRQGPPGGAAGPAAAAEVIVGTRMTPRKVWPSAAELDALSAGGCSEHGHHGASDGGCGGGRWRLRLVEGDKEGDGGGEWITVELQPPSSQGGGGGGGCSHGADSCHGHHHSHGHSCEGGAAAGAAAASEPAALSEEAKAWMAAHPDEKLPLHLCPTHGDCGTCPEREDCKWHSTEGQEHDIEDAFG